jgi:DNA polymerase
MAARLGLKSTLEETRTQRFLDIASRGLMPVPIRYYAAHTGRWGGDDKINLQNLPSRGPDAKTLKRSITAPDGMVLIDCDSSQIEARVLAWLAGQDDLTEAFREKRDVYKQMATTIYGVMSQDVTKAQRFVGKTTILGCGYGMGALRFQDQLKGFGVDVALEEAQRIVRVYRESNKNIVALWRRAGNVLEAMLKDTNMDIDYQNILTLLPEENGVLLPSGLKLRYDNLQVEDGEKGPQYTYKTRYGRTRIYGGKCVENWTQAIARCIIGEQMLKINKRYRPILTVHDSVIVAVPALEVSKAKAFVEECMNWTPGWAEGLPVACEAFAAVRYGDCDEDNPALVA